MIPVVIGIAACVGYAAFLAALAVSFRKAAKRAVASSTPSARARSVSDARPAAGDIAAGRPGIRVSVVIPARNEAHGIEACLDAVLASAGDDCEIIVVDDASTDATAALVRARSSNGAGVQIRLASLPEAPPGSRGHKKRAVAEGVRLARGTIVLQTDADSCPGPDWIPAMTSMFDQNVGFVAGPVIYRSDGSFFQDFQALEFAGLMGIAAAAMESGHPMLSSGANIAYRKDLYDRVRTDDRTGHLSSGDDVHLMHAIDRIAGVDLAFCLDPRAVVETGPEATVAGFFAQRSRWASKNGQVPDLGLLALYVTIYLAYIAFLASVPFALLVPGGWVPALGVWILKISAESLLLVPAARHFGRKRLLGRFLPSQPFQVLYVVAAPIAGMIGGFTWKGRSVPG